MPYLPILLALLCLTAFIGLALWLRASLRELKPRPEDQQALAELKGQVGAFSMQVEGLRQSLTTLQGQVVTSLDGNRRAMDERLDGAARVINDVRQNLGQLTEKTQRLAEIGKDIASLQDILRSPKLRGNIGELFLGDLLAQILPPDHFRMQHAFQGGEIVDAVVILKAGMVPVDAKFPLENFQRVVASATEDEKKTHRRVFMQDVKKHIDAIAKKYIRTDEGTFDFALMYIPAENVYYETIIRDDELGGDGALFEYALKKRVIPVSPNSFYAYLQTVLLGLKGMRIEERAREVINQLSRVHVEFGRFADAFRLVGGHLDNARAKYDEAQKRLEKVDLKLAQIDGVVQGAEPAALPDAS
ncbi:MAG TPA: DNA recombination protein RmuC [Kiritimatiellia bacterium]|nr:DNA recombination protein RmuC [Kiritimatiellia bacterium]